jgi:hypothetical protein
MTIYQNNWNVSPENQFQGTAIITVEETLSTPICFRKTVNLKLRYKKVI